MSTKIMASYEEDEVITPDHKVMYAARYNLGGVYSTKPLRVVWSYESECWFDRGGNLDVYKPGLDVTEGCVTFASHKREDVVHFLSGMLAVAYIDSYRVPGRRAIVKALERCSSAV